MNLFLENIPLIVVAAGAVVATMVEILKRTPVPTEKPKLVAFIIVLVMVSIAAISEKKFTVENAPTLATVVASVSVAAYGVYEVAKTAYNAIAKLIKTAYNAIAKLIKKK